MAGQKKLLEKQTKKMGGTSCPSPSLAGTAVNQQEGDILCHILEELQKIDQKLDSMESAYSVQQKKMTETADKVDDIAKKCLASTEEIQKVKKRVIKVEKHQEKQDNELLLLQIEKSDLTLRFQGLKEEEKEDLRDILAIALAPLIGSEVEKIKEEMDLAYRAYSNFTKKNKLPAEVVVKFTKQRLRDQILKAVSATPLKIGDQPIRILKDVPFEIRMKRKEYKGLTIFLQSHRISYRWLVPEGLVFKFKDRREKIDSIFKAQDFLKRHASAEEETELAKWMSGASGEDSSSEGEVKDEEAKGATGPKYNLRDKKGKYPKV